MMSLDIHSSPSGYYLAGIIFLENKYAEKLYFSHLLYMSWKPLFMVFCVVFVDDGSFTNLTNIVIHFKLGSYQCSSIVVINKFQKPRSNLSSIILSLGFCFTVFTRNSHRSIPVEFLYPWLVPLNSTFLGTFFFFCFCPCLRDILCGFFFLLVRGGSDV